MKPSFYFTGNPCGKTQDGPLAPPLLLPNAHIFPEFQTEISFPKSQIENSSLTHWCMKLNDANTPCKACEGTKLRTALNPTMRVSGLKSLLPLVTTKNVHKGSPHHFPVRIPFRQKSQCRLFKHEPHGSEACRPQIKGHQPLAKSPQMDPSFFVLANRSFLCASHLPILFKQAVFLLP